MPYANSAFVALLDRATEISRSIAAPQAELTDREARWPRGPLRALQEAGLGGLSVPVEAGGQGQGLRLLVEVCEVLANGCSSTALCFGMHCVGAACLAAQATPAQQERWLAPIAAGQHLTTLALSEPGTGAHFYLPQTRLTAQGDHYVIRGTKSFVTNGGYADSYVVSTVARRHEDSAGEVSCVAVPADAAGLVWQEPWRGIGMRGNSARGMELNDVCISRDDLLGQEGDSNWYFYHVIIPHFLIAMSGTYLGIARAALSEAVDHIKRRQYNFAGSAPQDSAVVQRELGILWRRLEACRRLVYHAATAADRGESDALLALCASKAEVAHCVVEVVNGAMTLVGGRGYSERSRLERLLRDGRAADIMAPTTQMLEVWTGRVLLGLPLLME